LTQSRTAQARDLAEKECLAARLESLLEALPGGVVVIDQHGLVQECSPVAGDLLGPVRQGRGSRKFAAEKLGISPRTLRYKIARMA
jgi:two-component system, sensor histidine kinase FlrB